MRHIPFFAVCLSSALLWTGETETLTAAEAAIPVMPTSSAVFPGTVFYVLHQIDGSAVCGTSDGVFFAANDLRRWSAVRSLPRERCFRPVGGDRDRFFVEDLESDAEQQYGKNSHLRVFGDAHTLYAVEGDRKVNVLRQNIPQGSMVAFASKSVGVIKAGTTRTGTGTSLKITIDGGATWSAVSLSLEGIQEDVSALLWVGPSQLLIGGSKGSVRLYEHDGHGALRQVWSAVVPGGVRYSAIDGGHVWLGWAALYRLKLADGKLDAKIEPEILAEGIAACHGLLLVWDFGHPETRGVHHGLDGFKTLEELESHETKVAAKEWPRIHVWARDPKEGYRSRMEIPAAQVQGILPLETPLCLVIVANGGNGKLLDLHSGKLSDSHLEVTRLPVPLADPNLATAEQIRAMLEFAARVPWRDRIRIFQDCQKTGLTGRKPTDLVTEKVRQYIETKKPGPVNLAEELAEQQRNNATPDQLATMARLQAQIPPADALAILDGVRKKHPIGLTHRQYIELAIKNYREYLEHDKPKPEEKNPSGEGNNGEKVPVQSGGSNK